MSKRSTARSSNENKKKLTNTPDRDARKRALVRRKAEGNVRIQNDRYLTERQIKALKEDVLSHEF